jgi:tripartite-type tricarboxylate transporter receptor subunit TctC
MNFPRRQFLHLTAAAAALPAVSRVARAQAYPSRPITMVVPFAAGGNTDANARILRGPLGQPVIIENVTGADGSIGTGRVARARPDGCTIDLGNDLTHVTNGATYALQYDVVNDFEPIAPVSTTPYLLLGKRALPVNDLNGLIAWLKANPNKATQGYTAVGAAIHLSGILFQKQTGTRFGFVPYRGGRALQALVAGQIDFLFMDPTTSLTQVRAGGVKAFAVAAADRLSSAPDIPTVDEAGLPGFRASLWHGLWVPPN